MRKTLLLAAAMSALSLGAAHAASITDPVGDFAKGYTGPHEADLDVTLFSVNYDAATQDFTLVGTMAGTINTAGTNAYVIGVDTGKGALHPFGKFGAGAVLFDQTLSVADTGVTTNANHSNLTADIAGDAFTLVVPLSDLPSTGFTADHYRFNLWPETATRSISDFSPNNGTLASVPEPGAWALMLVGVGALGFAMRRSRRTRLQPSAV